ncbi:MAG: amino acid adenylation domain-containing protein [Candidatus Eremiobacteraeota bacterium]|nr:amino acid adenylation domain-containing protein [Candidatus Eremiobacteraeota bacterium]
MLPISAESKMTSDLQAVVPLFDFEISRRNGAEPAPLSFAQELLWLMDRASPGTSVWNVPRAFRVRGPLDAAALERALSVVCERHEVLRTVFEDSPKGPRQIVRPHDFTLARIDLSAEASSAQQAELCERLLRNEAQRPFDLTRDVLLRAVLVTLAPDDRVFALTSHHIVSDGWSKSVLFGELSALYDGFAAGRACDLPALPIQFGDYAVWERAPERQATVASDLEYWSAQLRLLPVLDLPTDFPRTAVRSYEGARSVLTLPQALVDGIAGLSRARGVTPYMTLLAAYAALLHRYGGQDDVAIGSPIAARMHEETEGLIGYLANTLVLRCRLDGDPSFTAMLARVRETCLQAYEHHEIPFEQLVLKLQVGQQLSPAPFFQALLTMEDTLPAELRLGAATVEPIEADRGQIKVDLTLLAARVPDGLRLALWYRCDLFAPATAARMLGHLRTLLEAAIADPAQAISTLPLLTTAEEIELRRSNATSRDFSTAPVTQRFADAARREPEATAVAFGEVRSSYREVQDRAQALARRLARLGVGRGAFVGLSFERSPEFVAGLLGILQAGAAYVPLSPDLPPVRLALQVAESGVRIIVTSAANSHLFAAPLTVLCLDEDDEDDGVESGIPVHNLALAPAVGVEDAAYVVFTSGSTGVPKGVVVTHGNLANYVEALAERLELDPSEPMSFAFVSSPAADLGNTSLFGALCSGGTLHVIPAEAAHNGASFGALMMASPVDVLKITPSHLRALLVGSPGPVPLPRRWLILGGEACPWEFARLVRTLGTCRILNHYGPTEATIGATTYFVDDAGDAGDAGDADVAQHRAGTVPIGKPFANVTCYVLDERRNHVPVGIPGELYIGGRGVAAGYLNRPDLTAERFLPDSFASRDGGRLYRTGDRVRRLPSGELEFLGRFDGQVKVRGYRVELGEVESVLAEHPAVAQSVAMLRERVSGEPQLVAYVVAPADVETELRTWLQDRLPDYMLPSAIVRLERFPLSPNGKVDRALLPDPHVSSSAVNIVAPRTPTEEAIEKIWAEVLHHERLGVTEDFLALGLHSILAIRALGKLSRTFDVRLPLRALFEAPTIAALATLVDARIREKQELELQRALDALDVADDASLETPPADATLGAGRR